MDQFIDLFRGLAADLALRAVVLTGAGDKAFIGGASIDEMATLDSPQAARAFILKVHGCCHAIRQTPVPVIAAVNGWCLGAGLEVAAAFFPPPSGRPRGRGAPPGEPRVSPS